MIVFDVEIKKAILGRNETPIQGIEYCEGWRDFVNMGVACICTFDTDTYLARAFVDDNLGDFQSYIRGKETGGFNTKRFDIPLLEECGLAVDTTNHYDALEQIWLKCGLNPDKFVPATHGGWGLDAVMNATFGLHKTGHGAAAPVWWQHGEYGRVIDYCLNDAWLEAKLIMHMLNGRTVSAAGKVPLKFERRPEDIVQLAIDQENDLCVDAS
jgi:hypothetical protein